MLTLSVIGCGKVGKTLGRVWSDARVFDIGDVLNRRPDSARAATDFIGAGRPVAAWTELGRADVFMLSVPDDAIGPCAQRLAQQKTVAPGAIVFHCSGAKASGLLAELRTVGAEVASLHPVKSFADPRRAAETFPGTVCALEGDSRACAVLDEAIGRAGGRCLRVGADRKLVYHAGTVFVSNYLVSLLEVGVRCFVEAGMTRKQALSIALPLARGTLENVAALDTVDALTGPIARGDSGLVGDQLAALLDRYPDIGELYAMLGHYALELSRRRTSADPAALDKIEQAFARRLA
jgi:predicted short-subunit dehydrogenase-like oxidoreductase (DUF2520 family)